jgi:hypothetical protein
MPLLGALAGLVVCLASFVPAAAQNYPRLGQYLSTSGQGAPLVLANGSVDATLLQTIAKHHVVVLSASPFTEYRPDVINQLEALRPGIVTLAYLQPQYAYPHAAADSFVNIPTRIRRLVRDLNGYLYDKTGEEFRNANINLAKKQGNRFVVAEALADFYWTAVLQGKPWDGLFLDRFCSSILWDQAPGDSIDYQRAGYSSLAAFDVAWLAATDTLANRLRRNVGSAPVLVGNCATSTKYTAMNGWMKENFPYQNGGTWQTNMLRDPGGYLLDNTRFRSPRYNWLTAWHDPNQAPYSAENARRARYALGSAALGEGLGVINPPDLDADVGYWTWWYDEYGVSLPSGVASTNLAHTGWLGQPLAPYWTQFWVGAGLDGISNSGFDTDVTTGWTFTTTAGATWTRDTVGPPVGSASARATMPSAGSGIPSTRVRATSTLFYVPPNVHTVTLWAKASVPRTIQVGCVSTLTGGDLATTTLSIDTTWRQYLIEWSTGLGFGLASVEFRFGGTAGSVWLDDVHFQRNSTSIYRRDFTNGIVLVNPTSEPLEVPLEAPYQRIRGVADPVTNDGSMKSLVTVGASDALFLVRPPAISVGVEPGDGTGGPVARLWHDVAPNPAFGAVRARLETGAAAGPVRVVVLDVRGRRVATILDEASVRGTTGVTWDGRDASGRPAPAGIYWLHARVGARAESYKIVRLAAAGAGS